MLQGIGTNRKRNIGGLIELIDSSSWKEVLTDLPGVYCTIKTQEIVCQNVQVIEVREDSILVRNEAGQELDIAWAAIHEIEFI